MIGQRSFAMSGGAAAIGVLTGAKPSAPANQTGIPQAGNVILYSDGPSSAGIVGVIRPLTKTEAADLTQGAAALWTSSINGTNDIQRVLVSHVLSIVPFQWRKSPDLGAVIGLPNPNV